MAGKSFETAAKAAIAAKENEEETYPFEIDGVQCTAYKPDEAQLAMALTSFSKYTSAQEQIAGLINFFVGVLDKDSHVYLVNRLLDRYDPFGLKDVEAILEWLIEEWGGRPTQPLSASTSSRKSAGPSSTPPTPALT